MFAGLVRNPERVRPTGTPQYQIARTFGLMDADTPTPEQIRQYLRGLFSQCVKLRADAIVESILGGRGSRGFSVARRMASGELREVKAHPWLALIHNPSPYRSARDFWHWVATCRDVRGAADVLVGRGADGHPNALFELYPDFGTLEPVPDDFGGVASYVYHRADGQKIPVEARDVIRFAHPDVTSPYRTMGLLERAAYELDKQLHADIYERDSLKEGRFPPVVLETDEEISPDQADQFGAKFEAKHLGKQGIPILVKFKAKSLSVSAKDMELIDSQKLRDTHILQICGVMEGLISDKANRANAEAARFLFYANTVQGEADALGSQTTTGLARAEGVSPYAWAVTAPDVVPIDPEVQTRIDILRTEGGLSTINEIRRRNQEPVLDGGDLPLVSAALIPLRDAVKEPAPVPAPLASGTPKDDDEDAAPEESEEDRYAAHVRTALHEYRTAGPFHARTPESIDEEWRAVDGVRSRAFAPIARVAAGLFAEQGAEVVKRLRDAARAAEAQTRREGGDDEPLSVTGTMLFDLGRWTRETLSRLRPEFVRTILRGFKTGAFRAKYSGAVQADDPAVVRALDAINSKSRIITQTTLSDVNAIVQRGLRDRWSVDQMATALQRYFGTFASRTRARLIAQTSGTGAFEAGQREAFKRAGTRSRWVTQRDGRQRDSHDIADGQERAEGERFEVGGEALLHPGDPAGTAGEIMGCRCTLFPVLTDGDDD